MEFSESRSKKVSIDPTMDVQTDDYVTLQDSHEFLLQGGSNMFGIEINRNATDKREIKMIENPSSKDQFTKAKERNEEAQMVIRGAIALPLDESSNFIKCD